MPKALILWDTLIAGNSIFSTLPNHFLSGWRLKGKFSARLPTQSTSILDMEACWSSPLRDMRELLNKRGLWRPIQSKKRRFCTLSEAFLANKDLRLGFLRPRVWLWNLWSKALEPLQELFHWVYAFNARDTAGEDLWLLSALRSNLRILQTNRPHKQHINIMVISETHRNSKSQYLKSKTGLHHWQGRRGLCRLHLESLISWGYTELLSDIHTSPHSTLQDHCVVLE